MPSPPTDLPGADSSSASCPGRGLTVLYDGACPLCTREIGWYQRRQTTETIAWVDLTRCDDASLPNGVTRAEALARFHFIEASGQAQTGAAAFTRLWACYPGLRGLARLADLPGIRKWLEWGYRGSLRLRPGIARLLPPVVPESAGKRRAESGAWDLKT